MAEQSIVLGGIEDQIENQIDFKSLVVEESSDSKPVPEKRHTTKHQNVLNTESKLPVISEVDLEILGDEPTVGAFGKVQRVRWKGKDWALKTFGSRNEFAKELENMLIIGNKFKGQKNVLHAEAYIMDERFSIVYPWKRLGSLGSQMRTCQFLKRISNDRGETVRHIALQLTKAMSSMRSAEIELIHNDLKLDNVLLDGPSVDCCVSELEVVVGDFGAAAESNVVSAGTLSYLSPERVLNSAITSEKSDVWSFGVILWELCGAAISCEFRSAFLEYGKPCDRNAMVKILHEVQEPTRLLQRWNFECRAELSSLVDCMKLCLQRDEQVRPSWIQIERIFFGVSKDDQISSDIVQILKTQYRSFRLETFGDDEGGQFMRRGPLSESAPQVSIVHCKLVPRPKFIEEDGEIVKKITMTEVEDPINIEAIFQKTGFKKDVVVVGLQGRSGVGKSTFLRALAQKWAAGKLWNEFHAVVYLDLKDCSLEVKSGGFACLLQKALFPAHPEKVKEAGIFFNWTASKDVLWLFDSYDQVSHFNKDGSILNWLLDSSSSDDSKPRKILLASRPETMIDVNCELRLRINGFQLPDIVAFVRKYFGVPDSLSVESGVFFDELFQRLTWHEQIQVNEKMEILNEKCKMVSGFTVPKDVLRYIMSFCIARDYSIDQRAAVGLKLLEQVHRNLSLAETMKTPLLAEFVCSVAWTKEVDLESGEGILMPLTSLYEKVVCAIGRRNQRNHLWPQQISWRSAVPFFCKVAWYHLSMHIEWFVLEELELFADGNLNLLDCLKNSGLLNENRGRFAWAHHSVLEFMAAKWLFSQEGKIEDKISCIQSVSSNIQFILFCCGLSKDEDTVIDWIWSERGKYDISIIYSEILLPALIESNSTRLRSAIRDLLQLGYYELCKCVAKFRLEKLFKFCCQGDLCDFLAGFGYLDLLERWPKGAQRDVCDYAIYEAAREGHVRVVEVLLKKNASRTQCLIGAMQGNQQKIFDLVFDEVECYNTALIGAIRKRSNQMFVNALLSKGANRSVGLQEAVQSGNLEFAAFLKREFDVIDDDAWYFAARKGHLDVVRWLCQQGYSKHTLKKGLAGSAHGGHNEIVDLLLDESKKFDGLFSDNLIAFALDEAISRHQESLINHLLERCVNPKHLQDCMRSAIWEMNFELVSRLWRLGAVISDHEVELAKRFGGPDIARFCEIVSLEISEPLDSGSSSQLITHVLIPWIFCNYYACTNSSAMSFGRSWWIIFVGFLSELFRFWQCLFED